MANRTYDVMKDLSGYFKPGEREMIYYNCKSERDKLIIRLLWKSGRRVSEILRIKIKEINFKDNNILFNIEKKKKEFRKWKPIDSKTMEMIMIYVKSNSLKDEDWLFPSYSKAGYLTRQRVFQIIRAAAKKSQIYFIGEKPPHPHHFRHSFAIDKAKKLKSPADMRKLQQYLEHSNMGMTEQYLQFGDEDLRSLVEED